MNNEIQTKKCLKCGGINDINTNFCTKCGAQFNTIEPDPIVNTNINNITDNSINANVNNDNSVNISGNASETINANPINTNSVIPETPMVNMQNQQVAYVQQNVNSGSVDFIKYICNTVVKPFGTFKKEENNFINIKNSIILSSIIVVLLTITNLVSNIISEVRVTYFFSDEVEWVWENIKEVEYLKVIGTNLLTFFGILFAISAIYFIASRVIKKDVNFSKLLSAVTTAFIPFVLTNILALVINLLFPTLAIIINVIGVIYSLLIFVELYDDLFSLENKNLNILIHLICLSIVIIGGAFLVYKLIIGTLTSGFGSLF